MSILIRFRVEVEDLDAMHRVIDRVVNSHFQVSFNVDMADHVEPTDDEAADDIIKMLEPRSDVVGRMVDDLLASDPDTKEVIKELEAHQAQLNGRDNEMSKLIDAAIANLAARADDAPPHGIVKPWSEIKAQPSHDTARPKRGRPRGRQVVRPEAWVYYIDPSKAPTQGSGPKTDGIENVACQDCKAPVGEPCATFEHGAYRPGYGHAARREAMS